MSVVAMVMASGALAQAPTTIQDSHDRADVPRTAAVGKVIQDTHDRADVPRAAYVGKVIQDAHDRADLPRTNTVEKVIQDAHDRADLPRTNTVEKVIQDSHDRADLPQPVVVSSPTSFDWGDAAIGAVSGLGFAFLLAGLGFLVMSQRTRTRIATR